MMRSLSLLPLAALLTLGYPTLTLADETVDECRKIAAEEEVAPEDMEDYIAECLTVIQSESAEYDAEAADQPDAAADGDARPAATQPPATATAAAPKP